MEVREISGFSFTAANVAAFAPLVPVLASFAQQYRLEWSRVQAPDPSNPYAAYFLSWRGQPPQIGRWCWIGVRVLETSAIGTWFGISASGESPGDERHYLAEEGAERLRALLEQAWSSATHLPKTD